MATQAGDQFLITRIKQGGRAREEAVKDLISQYVGFTKTISVKVGLSQDQTEDAFTDALVVLMDHIERDVFRGESKISTYLYRICFNKSIDKVRYNSVRHFPEEEEAPELTDKGADLMHMLEIHDDTEQVKTAIAGLGEPCDQILLDWGFWGFNMTEIADRSGLRGPDHAKKQKYRCLKKLMKWVSPIMQGN